MTQPYTIDRGSNWRRQAVRDWLFGLDLVAAELQERDRHRLGQHLGLLHA